MMVKKCPQTGGECYQRYACEHTKRGTVVICMKSNVERWINQEPPFDKDNAPSTTSSKGKP